MAKLLIVLGILLISIIANAQDKAQTYAMEHATWDKKKKEWIWEPRINVELDIVVYNDVIIINDEARTSFITKDVIYEEGTEIRWNAFDNNKVDCVVGMYVFDFEKYIVVVYNNECYRYIY